MKRVLLLAAIVIPGLCCHADSGPAPLSLSAAVQRSLDNNREALASKKSVESARASLAASYGRFLPRVGVEGRWTRINAPVEIDLNLIRSAMISADLATLQAAGVSNPLVLAGFRNNLEAALPSFIAPVQNESYANLTATLTQPLFAGGKLLANTRAKKEELHTVAEQDRLTRNRVVIETVTAYARYQLAQQIVAIRQEAVEGIRQHQQNAERLLKEGVISLAQKMRTDVARAEAEREYAKALRDESLAALLFGNALGEPQAVYALTTPLALPPAVGPIDRYVTAGLAHNPNLGILAHREKLLCQKMNATRGEFLPTVAAFGKYELYREDLTLLEPEWAAGITAQLNLFNGGSDANDLKATKQQLEAVRLYREYAGDLVATEIRKNYHDLETASEQYGSLTKSRALAEENLRLNTLSFTEGTVAAIDVIDAQLALAKVKAEESRALYDATAALVNLMAASGNAQDFVNP